jgi:hypothetical protein
MQIETALNVVTRACGEAEVSEPERGGDDSVRRRRLEKSAASCAPLVLGLALTLVLSCRNSGDGGRLALCTTRDLHFFL